MADDFFCLKNLLRGLSLTALLMASSCAAPTNDANQTMEDPQVNHPIQVEPSYQSVRLAFSPADNGLGLADAARFDAFVGAYRDHGSGSIAVSAPAGPAANAAIAYFAGRINAFGIARDHIIVATHDAPDGDMRVELNYVAYEAHTDKCGDWSENLAYTADNLTPKNFGCAVQQNIAAMVKDPRDLIAPRPMDGVDPGRRAVVMGHYETGEPSAAVKRTSDLPVEQSAPGVAGVTQ